MFGKIRTKSKVVKPTLVEGGVEFDAPTGTTLFRRLDSAPRQLIGEILTDPRRFTEGTPLIGAGCFGLTYGFNPEISGLPPLAIKLGGACRNSFLLNASLEDALGYPERVRLPLGPDSGAPVCPAYSPTYYGFSDSPGSVSVAFPSSTSVTVMSLEGGRHLEPLDTQCETRNKAILNALNPVLANGLKCFSPDSKGRNTLYDENLERVTVLDIYQ